MKRYFFSESIDKTHYYFDEGGKLSKLRHYLDDVKFFCKEKGKVISFQDSIKLKLEEIMPLKRKSILYVSINLNQDVKRCLDNLIKGTKVKIKAVKDLREV